MTQELLSYIETSTGYSSSVADSILDSLSNFVAKKLREGEEVAIEGLGKFFSKAMGERIGRNPRTGEEIKVPPKTKARFRFSKRFTEAIQPAPVLTVSTLPSTGNGSEIASPSPVNELAIALQPAHQSVSTPTSPESFRSKATPPPIPVELLQPQETWFISNDGKYEEVWDIKRISLNQPVWSERTGWKLAKDIPELASVLS